jgi:hypothetical protein
MVTVMFRSAPIAYVLFAIGIASLAASPSTGAFARSLVTLEGTVEHVFNNKFVLRHHSGRVLVDTGPPWFAERIFHMGEPLEVHGQLSNGELDAISIRRADGTEERIRNRSGPPPWAGIPRRLHGDQR